MNVRKAHRRWMAWQRYHAKTGSRRSNPRLGGNHRGMVLAFSNLMFAGRVFPKGPRTVHLVRTTWEVR